MKNLFSNMTDDQYIDYINNKKKEFGKSLAILAHHYQNYDIVKLGDVVGDSYKLAVEGSKSEAEFIVFCGVRFMAEGAKILANAKQKVLIPDIMAGCPMADMINIDLAQKAYDILSKRSNKKIRPVVYMNSYADMKHFCGTLDGSVCTSSNAKKIVEYYLNKGESVFFFPDYNLGINTAVLLNIDKDTASINKNLQIVGDVSNSKMILWDGYCHVHKTFTISDIENLKRQYENIKIIVHPECSKEVAALSDVVGSTEQIYKAVKEAESGSIMGIGTEGSFVERLSKDFPDKTILHLKDSRCFNMLKITLKNLAHSIQSIIDNQNAGTPLKFEIPEVALYKEGAKKALNKMIDIVEGGK